MRHRYTHPITSLFAAFVLGPIASTTPALGQVIHENSIIIPDDGDSFDWFGSAVGIDNGLVAISSQFDDDNGSQAGAVYVFDLDSGNQLFKLISNEPAPNSGLGNALAFQNGIIAVGSKDDDGIATQAGAAYLFDAITGTQLFKLIPNDADERDEFGSAIAMDNGVVAVSAWLDEANGPTSGSAYLFDALTGTQIIKLNPSDGAAEDFFGISIAIGEGIVAVGAVGDTDNGPGSGSVYLFDAKTGAEIAKLLPIDGDTGDSFGGAVAIGNGIVAVGAAQDEENGTRSGSVYLFDLTTHAQLNKIFPDDAGEFDDFGSPLAIDGGILAVGERSDNVNGQFSGSAYLFNLATGNQLAKVLPFTGGEENEFGGSIAIENGTVIIGEIQNDLSAFNSGAAYVVVCHADLNGDFNLDFLDISMLIALILANDPSADFNNDGTINFFDISAFLAAFSAGCP